MHRHERNYQLPSYTCGASRRLYLDRQSWRLHTYQSATGPSSNHGH
jgi:hypothetical protein